MKQLLLAAASVVLLSGCAILRGDSHKYDVSMNFDGAGLVERKYCQAPADSLEWSCFVEKCQGLEGDDSCQPISGDPAIRVAYLRKAGADATRNPAEESHYTKLTALKEGCERADGIENCVAYYDAIRIDRSRTSEMNDLRERICTDKRIRCEDKRIRQEVRVKPAPGCRLETLRALPELEAANPEIIGGFQIVDLGSETPEQACDGLFEEIHRQRRPVRDHPLAKGEKLLVRREHWTVSFPGSKPVGTLSTRIERIVLKKGFAAPAKGPKPASTKAATQ